MNYFSINLVLPGVVIPSTNYIYKPTVNRRKFNNKGYNRAYLRLDDGVRSFKDQIVSSINQEVLAHIQTPPEDIFCIISHSQFFVDRDSYTERDVSNMVKCTEDALFSGFSNYDDKMVNFSSQGKSIGKLTKLVLRFGVIEYPEEYNMYNYSKVLYGKDYIDNLEAHTDLQVLKSLSLDFGEYENE